MKNARKVKFPSIAKSYRNLLHLTNFLLHSIYSNFLSHFHFLMLVTSLLLPSIKMSNGEQQQKLSSYIFSNFSIHVAKFSLQFSFRRHKLSFWDNKYTFIWHAHVLVLWKTFTFTRKRIERNFPFWGEFSPQFLLWDSKKWAFVLCFMVFGGRQRKYFHMIIENRA